MKKLMIAAVIVAVASFANAASYSWGWTSGAATPGSDGATWDESCKAFLYLGTVAFDSKNGWDLGSATLLTTSAYDANWGLYGNTDTEALSSNDAVDAAGGQGYTLVLINGSADDLSSWTGDGKYYALVTGTSDSVTEPTATGSITYASMVSDTYVDDSVWQSAATTGSVPEPTSAMLLLLGVAGLALRRKQA